MLRRGQVISWMVGIITVQRRLHLIIFNFIFLDVVFYGTRTIV